ncbi:response regulator [bacterium]|nr:MAG: response regulator [bacterium]
MGPQGACHWAHSRMGLSGIGGGGYGQREGFPTYLGGMADKSILIIDDDQTLVAAIKEGLETLGFRVAAAFDGLQGVLQAHQSRPDAVMLDFNMPAGGGAGVYERLRTSSVTAQTPIIFLTAATVEEVKKVIRSTPNTYFLKKPISVGQLRKVLDKILGGHVTGPVTTRSRPVELSPKTRPPAPVDDFAGLGGLPTPPPMAPPAGMPMPAPTPAPAPAPAKSGGLFGPMTPPPAPFPKQVAGFGAMPPPPAPAPTPAPAPVGGFDGHAHVFDLRVGYADTDRLGIVYYGTYLRYFELGRTEFLRALGLRYRDIEMERRFFLPAVEARAQYLAPCRYDDQLRLRTWVSWLGPASVCFQNELVNVDEGGRLVARGFTRHAVLNEQWKPSKLPPDIRQRLQSVLKAD